MFERRHVVGGAAVTEEIVPGFKFSRASYLLSLLRPVVVQELELKVRHPLVISPPSPPSLPPHLHIHHHHHTIITITITTITITTITITTTPPPSHPPSPPSPSPPYHHHVIIKSPLLSFIFLQKHGLKVYLRDPSSYTPVLGTRDYLLLSSDPEQNKREISKFSKKDAEV